MATISRRTAKPALLAVTLALTLLALRGAPATSADGPPLSIEQTCGPNTFRPDEWVVYQCLIRVKNNGSTPLSNIRTSYKSALGVIPRHFFVLYEVDGQPMPIDPTGLSFGTDGVLQPGQTADVRLVVLLNMPGEGAYAGYWPTTVDGEVVRTPSLNYEGKADAAEPPTGLEVSQTRVETPNPEATAFETLIINRTSQPVTNLSLMEHWGGGGGLLAAGPAATLLLDAKLAKWDLASFGKQSLAPGEMLAVTTTYQSATPGECDYVQTGVMVEATIGGEVQRYGASAGDASVGCGSDENVTPLPSPPAEPRVLVTGAPIHGTNGVMFDAKDRLYIASSVGREIVVMDPETGKILDRLGPKVGVESPDDLAFGPDGSLYWTAILTGEVGRLSPDGVKTSQSVALGVNPITFSDDGRLFVALDFLGDALYELDPNLVEPPRLIAENLGFLNGMDWGPDGFLYGPIWTKGKVVRIDVDTGTVTTVADGFGVPAAVKFDSQGRLYVGDQTTGEVSRVDLETGSREVIASGLFGLDNLAFDSQDRLFVSNTQDGSISEVLPHGTTRTVSPGGMIAAGGVAVLPTADDESVFVADLFTLREFDGRTGEERGVQRASIAIPGSMTTPMTVSPDGDHLVLSSWFGNAVQVWDPEARDVLEHLDFGLPLNAIRFQGDLVVAGLASVVRASAADPAVRVTLADGLKIPAGLAATDDDLWVSERGTGSVLQIMADGKQLSEPMPVATGLSSPEGLAPTPGGNLLVVEAGAGRLSLINTSTGEVSAVAEGLELGAEGTPGMPPTWGFNGVAVGPSGAIYVTGDIGSVLYRIEAVKEAPAIAPAPPATGGGGLQPGPQSSVAAWWCALAAGGVLLLAAGGWYARRRWRAG